MRDVVDSQVTETEISYHNGVPVSGNPSGLRKTRVSQRSDPLPTTPISGARIATTEYEAFFMTSSSSAAEAEYKIVPFTGSSIYSTIRRTEATGLYVDQHWNWGTSFKRPAVPSSVISRARNKAIDKIRSNDLNLAVAVGEMKETVKTVTSLLMDIVKIVRGFKKLPGSAAGYASEWLRYQYGIKPLMSDIAAAIDVLKNGLDEPLAKVTVDVPDDTYKGPSPNTGFRTTYDGEFHRGCEVGYYLKLTNPTAFKAWQLGLTDLPSLIWELTTLSFVVDWFLHVGDFLQGLNRPLGLTVLAGYQTLYLRNSYAAVRDLRPAVFNGKPTIPIKEGSVRAQVALTSMYRQKLDAVTGGAPYLSLNLNLTQALNGLALIASRRP